MIASERLGLALAVVLAGVLEAKVLREIWSSGATLDFLAVMIPHVLASAAMFFAAPRGAGWLHRDRRWGAAQALWTFLLPGVGWLLIAGLRWEQSRGESHANWSPPEEENDEGLPETASGGLEQVYEDAADVLPAADALLGTDAALKRGAIEALARIKTPESIALLLNARRDSSSEVRFFATTALTRLKDDFNRTVAAAERSALERPTDAAAQIQHCQALLAYAVSGLMDAHGREDALKRCRRWLSLLAEKEEEALKLLYLVNRRQGEKEAIENLDALLKRRPQERSEWLKEKSSLLFEQQRYPEAAATMAELGRELDRSPQESPDERDWHVCVLWWKHD